MFLWLVVFLSFIVPSCCVESMKQSLPQKCLQKYKKVVARFGDEKGHCFRLQLIVNCFSKRRNETGKIIDHMRYLFMQESLFVNKLDICDIDFGDLKEITSQTDVAQKHRYLDSVDDDEWDACAGEIHKTCIREYLSLMSQQHKVCTDGESWIACYSKEAEKQGCNAQILQHFTKMLQVVGRSVMKSIRRHMGVECSRFEL